MSEDQAKLAGPDLTKGVSLSTLKEGVMLRGHAHGEPALLARRGDEVFAIGAVCTHYGAPLEEGLLVDDTVRCPWHHACFSLRDGEALRAPALDPVFSWRVEQRDGCAYVQEKLERAGHQQHPGEIQTPASIVILGGGGAGNAAAEMLRREGYAGQITMLSADQTLPCDRPKLSKGYLAGSEVENTVPLRSAKFYKDHHIELKLDSRVASIDVSNQRLRLAKGGWRHYDSLLLATGAEPRRLEVPGADLPHVHYLRTVGDSQALVAKALASRRAVVIGSSFIGLEVTASLRERGIEVHVVGRDQIPMERLLGVEIGTFIRKLHEDHGVAFHPGGELASIDERRVTLKSGETLDADFIVAGIGVRPAIALAEQAGLATDHGVMVNEYLETNVPGIFAAGDIALWPDRHTGERIRVEHWIVAERQGQTAARNMLGRGERFNCVPFFWTIQYDFGLGYLGHAEHWDRLEIVGSLEARDCTVSYWSGDKKMALAIIGRDLEGLCEEVEFERAMTSGRA